ncbi:MAG: VCBS repeat-containing protein [Elusimicrobia bacterium]|nr:VCBS repeat-containing protein [Elusimicrobiota bacterium]
MGTLLFAAFFAAAAQAAPDATVVRVDSTTVYLDLAGAAASAGEPFEVLSPGADLKNPVTGADLGPILTKTGAGTLTDVEPKYAVGRLSEGTAEPGWRARLSPAAPAAAAGPAPSAPSAAGAAEPAEKSPLLPLTALDLAVADVDGDGAPEAVLADADHVEVRRMTGDWPVVCSFAAKPIGARFLSVEARDLDGDGRAEVFASLYDRPAKEVETLVLDCRGGRLVQRAALPYLVRAFSEASGARSLAAQSLEPDSSFPASRIRRLVWKDGGYRLAKESLKARRLEWLYGFALASAQGRPLLLQVNDSERLTVRFPKGAWTTPEAYGYPVSRLTWHGSTFEFHPRLLTRVKDGSLEGVVTVRNVPSLLGLAAPFGLYGRSELHVLAFDGMSLKSAWSAPLPGMAADVDAVPASGGRPERLAVAVAGAGGRTSVWLFDR